MLDERPSMPVTVGPSTSGPLHNFVQKLGEPRVLGWIAVASVLIVWEVIVVAAHLNPIYLPSPSHILVALVTMFKTGGLLSDLLATLGRIFGGFAIALVVGTLLGIWMATSQRVSAIADNFIAALYPLPKVTLIPLLIIWLGTGGPFMIPNISVVSREIRRLPRSPSRLAASVRRTVSAWSRSARDLSQPNGW